MRRLVARVLELATLQSLLADLQQQVARLGRGPGGHLVVVGVGREGRAGRQVEVAHERKQ